MQERPFTPQQLAGVPDAAVPPRQRLEFRYDARGRRIMKKVYFSATTTGSPSWKLNSALVFLYDGWNLVAEVDALDKNRVVRSYVWGPDVSGSLQGAGGVGGLLTVKHHQASVTKADKSSVYLTHADANGNITTLIALVAPTSATASVASIKLPTPTVAARWDYDAFGNRYSNTLPHNQAACPFGFSSKYEDAETGLYYYGYRYYSPELGRWPSRDPIGERGGINLYGMVGNDAVNKVDYLGLVKGPFGSRQAASIYGASWSAALTEKAGSNNNINQWWVGQVEYGGSICKCEASGEIGITTPVSQQTQSSVIPSSCPEGWVTLGTFHSHPFVGDPGNSKQDQDNVDPLGLTSTVLRANTDHSFDYQGDPANPRGKQERFPKPSNRELQDTTKNLKEVECSCKGK